MGAKENELDLYQDSESGELIPPETWFPQVVEYLTLSEERHPEEFDLAAVRTCAPDIFQQILEVSSRGTRSALKQRETSAKQHG